MSEDPNPDKTTNRPIVSDHAVRMILMCILGSVVIMEFFTVMSLTPERTTDILGGAGITLLAFVMMPAFFKAIKP